uniref:Ig-like domain-containing protein n=1 Tax=Meloidogyne hapla TaxID=6305 RepID=A0A1I8BT17_MELHA
MTTYYNNASLSSIVLLAVFLNCLHFKFFVVYCLRPSRSPLILDESMNNLTAMRGDTVEFICIIENAGKYKIAFFRDGIPPRLVAYDESIFRRTDKYELLSKLNGNQWLLRIKDIQEDDSGGYICQLNSNPILTKTGYLNLKSNSIYLILKIFLIKVPPIILKSSTPAAVEVREGLNVTLSCNARGNPVPTIVWRRADKQIIKYGKNDGYGDSVHKGPDLVLRGVSRQHMSEYICTASNGIFPDESWTIKLHVLFEPVVVPQMLIVEAPLNATYAKMACTVEAWPRPNLVWLFKNQPLHDSEKYSTEQSVSERYRSVHLLKIKNIRSSDFGIYKCVANNDYGSHFAMTSLIPALISYSQSIVPYDAGSGVYPNIDEENDEDSIEWGDTGIENPFGILTTTTTSSLWLRKQQKAATSDK